MADFPHRRGSPPSLTWVGQRVGERYEVHRQLAKGGMGRVFLAVQHPLGRDVALKVLDPNENASPTAQYEGRFFREASTLAKLHDPHTVRVYDYGSWNGRLYLVMEYVEGPSLRALLREEGRIGPQRAVRIARHVVSSLSEAHAHGVVHRDLKPGNILLSQRVGQPERAKVVDFGLVKESRSSLELTSSGLLLGTPKYMSPEQISGEEVDGRSDIYSLGVVLFKMLTGKAPYTASSTAGLLHAHVNAPVPYLTDRCPELQVPDMLEWTVRTMLAKSRQDRFGDVGELEAALDACDAALRDPAIAKLSLTLVDGRVVVPAMVSDASISQLLPPMEIVEEQPEVPDTSVVPSSSSVAFPVFIIASLALILGALMAAVVIVALVMSQQRPSETVGPADLDAPVLPGLLDPESQTQPGEESGSPGKGTDERGAAE